MGVRIDPGDHEDGQPLVHHPFDQGFVGREVEHVELVDPGRHQQHRNPQHRIARRRVLDELHQFVLEHDLAGRQREVAADLELARVGLAQFQLAVAGLDVLGQHLHAAHEVFPVRRQRLAQHFRVGENEIGGRDRRRDLLHVEIRLVARVRIEPLGVAHQLRGPIGGDEIGLLHRVEERILRPFRIGEAAVRGGGRGHRRHGLARHALHRSGPQVEIALDQTRLRFDGALRVGQPVFGDLAERLGDVGELVGHLVLDGAVLARLHVGGHGAAALIHEARKIPREGLRIDGGLAGCVLGLAVHRFSRPFSAHARRLPGLAPRFRHNRRRHDLRTDSLAVCRRYDEGAFVA